MKEQIPRKEGTRLPKNEYSLKNEDYIMFAGLYLILSIYAIIESAKQMKDGRDPKDMGVLALGGALLFASGYYLSKGNEKSNTEELSEESTLNIVFQANNNEQSLSEHASTFKLIFEDEIVPPDPEYKIYKGLLIDSKIVPVEELDEIIIEKRFRKMI